MGRRKLGQLADQRAVPAKPQGDVIVFLYRSELLQLQHVTHRTEPWAVYSGERGALPDLDRISQQFGAPVIIGCLLCLRDEAAKAVKVNLALIRAELVAAI